MRMSFRVTHGTGCTVTDEFQVPVRQSVSSRSRQVLHLRPWSPEFKHFKSGLALGFYPWCSYRYRPRVPCVPCVSRLPPVSFYRYRHPPSPQSRPPHMCSTSRSKTTRTQDVKNRGAGVLGFLGYTFRIRCSKFFESTKTAPSSDVTVQHILYTSWTLHGQARSWFILLNYLLWFFYWFKSDLVSGCMV